MKQDIASALSGWKFDPHGLTVRMIRGSDDRMRVQMRIEMGIVQMELNDRPDGERPRGFDSLLEYFESEASKDAEFKLNRKMLEALHREGQQYYQRYLCLFQLGLFDLVARDCSRNLRLFQFVRRFSRRRKDVWRFDRYRPYLLMMNARALAMLALAQDDRAAAIECIDAGCSKIRDFLTEYDRENREEYCFELEFLLRWRDEIVTDLPDQEASAGLRKTGNGRLDKLRSSLDRAVRREDYERAAMLRDQIKRIEEKHLSS